MRTLRRRTNLHLLQHVGALGVTVAALSATGLILAALRGNRVVFALTLLAAVCTLAIATVLLARRVAGRWLPARDAAARTDAACGLRGRLVSVLELENRAHGAFFDLLVRQNHDALPRWRPEDIVPEVVPARAFATSLLALSLLALVVVLAPKLRPPAPRVVVGDRRMDFVPVNRETAGADRILVAPGVEQHPPGRDGEGADEAVGGEETGGLANLSGSLQEWLQNALGAEEHWEAGDERPLPTQAGSRTRPEGRTPASRPAADPDAPTGAGRAADGDGAASRQANADQAGAEESGGGGGGAGAGTSTDPTLYGAPGDEVPAGADRFELAIAARVRTRRGGAMSPWTTAPDGDEDRHPVLAGTQRSEQPGHRMAVPASLVPLVRRLYAHRAPAGDAR
jgi:hypothetical protein